MVKSEKKHSRMLEAEKFFENRIGELLKLSELADRLKMSVSGLRKLVARDDRFPRLKVGQQLRFSWSSVERYLLEGA